MKRILFQIILLFSVLSLSAYDVDSLLSVIENKNLDRSKAYIELYKIAKRVNRDSAKTFYLERAYYEALKHDNKKELGAALNSLGNYYKFKTEFDTAKVCFERALKVRLEIKDTLGISKVYNNLAVFSLNQNRYEKAIEYLKQAIQYRSLLEDTRGVGISYFTLGNVYNKWGKNTEAIDNYMRALKLFEKVAYQEGVSTCYNNIGNIYQNMSQGTDTVLLNKALEQMMNALDISKRNQLFISLAESESGVANIYAAKADIIRQVVDTAQNKKVKEKYEALKSHYFSKAFEYSRLSAEHHKQMGNKVGEAASNIGAGAILINRKQKGDIKAALEYFEKALPVGREIGDEYLTTVCLIYIGKAYSDDGKNQKALKYLFEAESIAEKNNFSTQMTAIYEPIADAYDSLGNYRSALKYYRNFHRIYEEKTQQETKKTIADLEIKHETDKKEAALELANKENEKQQLKSERQQLIIYGFIGVFVIIIIFSFIVLKQFKQIQKNNKILSEQKAQIEKANEELNQQNEEIAAQKDHIEKIHEEVSDSIHYAERIQTAILPQVEEIDKKISDRFILFKPKDIVSGDFYWQRHLPDNNLYVATAADCTGHGVPGAFMSMLGVAFLNEIVTKASITETGQVLDALRQSVITSLHQTGEEGEAQDGMDISLIALDYESKLLQFSGANNPLYIIRPKDHPAVEIAEKMVEGETYNLYEIKGDKMPIGIYKKELTNFKTNVIQLMTGDSLYMFSDGYADQFGGPKGKKLKYLPFKRLLIENVEKPMSEQSKILNEYFENWRGELSQIDDVIVFGVKV